MFKAILSWDLSFWKNPLTGFLRLIYLQNVQIVFGGPTSLYKIEKSVKSSGNAIVLRFYDELYQPILIRWDSWTKMKVGQ